MRLHALRAIGQAEDRDAGRLSQVERIRGDRGVALDEQHIDAGQIKFRQRLSKQLGVEIDVLDAAYTIADAPEALGVAIGPDIADDHADAKLARQSSNRPFQQRRLAAARGAIKANGMDVAIVERFVIENRRAVVDAFGQGDIGLSQHESLTFGTT